LSSHTRALIRKYHDEGARAGKAVLFIAGKRSAVSNLGYLRHVVEQLFIDSSVFTSDTQLARRIDVVREQADMGLYRFIFLRWLLKNAAKRSRVPGKEDVMAKLIEFYVPANFQTPKTRWTPEELRGKIIDFRASTTRKSA
jgi:hypothetical protein